MSSFSFCAKHFNKINISILFFTISSDGHFVHENSSSKIVQINLVVLRIRRIIVVSSLKSRIKVNCSITTDSLPQKDLPFVHPSFACCATGDQNCRIRMGNHNSKHLHPIWGYPCCFFSSSCSLTNCAILFGSRSLPFRRIGRSC